MASVHDNHRSAKKLVIADMNSHSHGEMFLEEEP
jgi:hypothetical protein